MTADAAYGFSKGWRTELERADVFHVMATTRHELHAIEVTRNGNVAFEVEVEATLPQSVGYPGAAGATPNQPGADGRAAHVRPLETSPVRGNQRLVTSARAAAPVGILPG